LVTPTATTCEMFRDGTSADLTELFYGVKSRKINSVSPGVLFYYSKVSAPASSFTITVGQTKSSGSFPYLAVHQGQAVLYSASCTKLAVKAQISNHNGTVTYTVTGATAGEAYIAGIKYDPSAVVGTNVNNPPYPSVDYGWATSLDPGGAVIGTADALTLKPR
jgi:hypothetical protein